jgi:hypothetical protein
MLGFELGAYTLSHFIRHFFVVGFFEVGSHKLLGWAALDRSPPHLCLLSS